MFLKGQNPLNKNLNYRIELIISKNLRVLFYKILQKHLLQKESMIITFKNRLHL